MATNCKRAFERFGIEGRITYCLHNTEKYFNAKMVNTSEGGMYFESEVEIQPGSDIYITLEDPSPAIQGLAEYDGYRAEVMWCRKLYDKETERSYYGVGVRFMVNTCGQCGETVPYKDIHKTLDFLFLCTDCMNQLQGLSDGKIKSALENYLIGNVL